MNVDWKLWLPAWAALWILLVLIAEMLPSAAGVVGIFAGGLAVTVVGELLYNGSLIAGLKTLGVSA